MCIFFIGTPQITQVRKEGGKFTLYQNEAENNLNPTPFYQVYTYMYTYVLPSFLLFIL